MELAAPLPPGTYDVWVGRTNQPSVGALRLPVTAPGELLPGDGEVKDRAIYSAMSLNEEYNGGGEATAALFFSRVFRSLISGAQQFSARTAVALYGVTTTGVEISLSQAATCTGKITEPTPNPCKIVVIASIEGMV